MAKKTALYGIAVAVAMIFGYIESLVPLSFIAPGVKLGLANAVVLLIMLCGDFKGALLINIVRILLSTLLFSAPSTLIYSLSAGITSVVGMILFSKIKSISAVGYSIIGAVIHNIAQLTVASLILGGAVWYYTPFLLLSALISGLVIGLIAILIETRGGKSYKGFKKHG